MRAVAAFLLMLAGCGAEPAGGGNASTEQIERLSTPQEQAADPLASARLQPIDPGEITHEGLGGPSCSFAAGGATLLVATGEDAIARVRGRLIHLTHSAPVGPSGGFFEDRHTSISIGRTDARQGSTAAAIAGWPARLTATNRRTGAQVEVDGIWRCDA